MQGTARTLLRIFGAGASIVSADIPFLIIEDTVAISSGDGLGVLFIARGCRQEQLNVTALVSS
jgi:hypothetical protein